MSNLIAFCFTNKSDKALSEDRWIVTSKQSIDSLSGDDTIAGRQAPSTTDDWRPDWRAAVINEGAILTSLGNDNVRGTGNRYHAGLYNSGLIDTGGGDDTVQGIGGYFEGGGIVNSGQIITRSGNDKIFASQSEDLGGSALRNGAMSGTLIPIPGRILMGDGDDSILAKATSSSKYSYSLVLWNLGLINTGQGNDTITGLTPGSGAGIYNDYKQKIYMEYGNDTIIGASGNLLMNGLANDKFVGIHNNGLIDTGFGNDVVDGSQGGFDGDGTTYLGPGNDTLKGFGTGLFYGDSGSDKLILGNGRYSIKAGAITQGETTMKTFGFELIGGPIGKPLALKDGILIIQNEIAAFL